ncbi:hypothetical protein ACFONN_10345 [Dyella humi]|uniref:Uncharacterized protein n=1 Tax=Dyella humi TaxID=1770547 RepID=A0ABW8IL00_9GAMM
MDIAASLDHLSKHGFVVEEHARPDGSRHWFVFNPKSPFFFENDGSPDIFDDRGLVFWVQHVMLPVWEAGEETNLLPDATQI